MFIAIHIVVPKVVARKPIAMSMTMRLFIDLFQFGRSKTIGTQLWLGPITENLLYMTRQNNNMIKFLPLLRSMPFYFIFFFGFLCLFQLLKQLLNINCKHQMHFSQQQQQQQYFLSRKTKMAGISNDKKGGLVLFFFFVIFTIICG